MKFTAAIAVVASAILSMVSAQGGTYTDISNVAGFSPFNITSASLAPYPLCINKPACLTLTGTLSEALPEGLQYIVEARYLGRIVYSDREEDLCSRLAENGTPCPLPAGPVNLTLCRVVKPNMPPDVSSFI
jgi:hypothetical protein